MEAFIAEFSVEFGGIAMLLIKRELPTGVIKRAVRNGL